MPLVKPRSHLLRLSIRPWFRGHSCLHVHISFTVHRNEIQRSTCRLANLPTSPFQQFSTSNKTGEGTWYISRRFSRHQAPQPNKARGTNFSPPSIPNMQEATNSLPSSSERSSSSAAAHMGVKEAMESDEEIRRVPELGGELAGPSTSGRDGVSVASEERTQGGGGAAEARRRKRGGSPADKEHKRLKRLLRNRVSAQQARERKKAYLTELEGKVKDLEKRNSELEERHSTLQNENQMLRQILKNTTVGRKGSSGGGNGEASA